MMSLTLFSDAWQNKVIGVGRTRNSLTVSGQAAKLIGINLGYQLTQAFELFHLGRDLQVPVLGDCPW